MPEPDVKEALSKGGVIDITRRCSAAHRSSK